MEEPGYKNLSLFLLIILLPVLLFMSSQASISGDEFLHRDQAEAVIDYFFSFGENQKALDTPVTNLKYYGQSYDNIASLIARIFDVDDIFFLRHMMSAFAGWLIIVVATLMARKTEGWQTAFFTIIILGISPRFIGHSLNNLKDIPFALGYITGIYFIYSWINEFPHQKVKTAYGLVAAISFSISIRPPGLIIIAYLGLTVTVTLLFYYLRKEIDKKDIVLHYGKTLLIMVTGYFAGLLFWPYALENPIVHPIVSHQIMEAYPVTIRQLFMGKMIWSDMLPWYYIPWMIIISVPLLILAGIILFVAVYRFKESRRAILLLLFASLFPIIYIIANHSNVYGGWRHLLFIYPTLAIVAAYGLTLFYKITKTNFRRFFRLLFIGFVVVMVVEPVLFMVRNHPFHYLYFNPVVGGYKKAFSEYEADYYFNTIQPAALWLNSYIIQTGEKDVKVVSNFETAWHFRNNKQIQSVSQTSYYNRNRYDWDYAVFSATYLHKHTLTNGCWPPLETIHTIKTDNIPVCVVLKRLTKNDYLGSEALKKGVYERAIETLSKSVEENASVEGAWLDYGRALYQTGDYTGAMAKLNQAVKIHPLFEPALLEMARCKIINGDNEEALSIINHLLHNNIKYMPAWQLKSEILIKSNRTSEAVKSLKEALTIQPSFKPARDKLFELTGKQ